MIPRAVVLTLLVLAGGLLIQRASAAEPLVLRTGFNAFPMAIDGWSGRQAARFDDRTLAILGVDEYLHRIYQDAQGFPAALYIGFYGSQRQADTMHSPLNCLPGAGWQPSERGVAELTVRDSPGGSLRTIRVNEFIIQKGAERQVALYWYQSHGRVTANEYRSKVYTVLDALRLNRTDGAIIRVTGPMSGAADARLRTRAFVEALF